MSNENKTMQIVMPDVPDTIPSQEYFVYVCLPDGNIVDGEAASSIQLKDAGSRAITKGKRAVNFGGYNEVLQPAAMANGYQNTNNGKYGEVGGQFSYTAFDNAIAKGKGVAALVKNAVVYGSSNQENNPSKIAGSYLIVGATKDSPKDFSATGNEYKAITFKNFNGVNTYVINDNSTEKVLEDYLEELWDSLPVADKIQVGAAEESLTIGAGNLNLLLGGFIGGTNNKGKGTGGIIYGTNNRSVGDNCDINGDGNNSVGDEIFINGYQNRNNGNYNKIFGNNNNINASYCIINGDANISNFNHCKLDGYALIADKADQTLMGRYNAPSNADFVFGNGNSSSARSNALEVYKTANGAELKIGNTTINETQLQALLALI